MLLLDRWALLDPERRALVQRFDELNPAWVSVLEPWAEDDPDGQDAGAELGGLAGQVLARKRGELRPSFHGVQLGLPDLSAFDRELPLAAIRAMTGFEDRTRQQTTAEEQQGSSRPSLRDAFGSGSRQRADPDRFRQEGEPGRRGDRPRGPTGYPGRGTWNGDTQPGSGEADQGGPSRPAEEPDD
ncbi:hypothetical protein GXW82_29790 [Streptacidiphilus sp. 4-A2]|nr:hypothetical protein [Streptacidiphilus sp. 4-A2]